jgi:hypothetical protein
MKRICDEFRKTDPTFPPARTIRDWITEDESEQGKAFAKQYARAKAMQIEHLVDQIVDISDDSSLDMAFTEDGKAFVDHENIQRSRLRVDSRKWIASKLLPKKYGDRIAHDHTVRSLESILTESNDK